jgi:hypothetical protein
MNRCDLGVQHMLDMEKELQDGEGCRVYGELHVRRIEGLVRLSTHVQDFLRLQSTRQDLEKQIQTAVENIKAHNGAGNLEVCFLLCSCITEMQCIGYHACT